MNKLMFTVALVTTAGAVSAQEMGTPAPTAGTTAQVSVTATAVVVEDGAQEAIDQAVEKAPAANQIQPTEEFVSAEELVEKRLNALGLTFGYNDKKKAIIQPGSASIKVLDPANDKSFMLAREQLANSAYMNAKAQVIRAISTEFSAFDRAMISSESGEDETAKKFAAKKAEIEESRQQLAALMAKVDSTEAATVSEVTINDRFSAFLDAVIKKIDSAYSAEALAARKVANAEAKMAEAAQLKEKCAQLIAQCKVLEAEAEAMPKDPDLESSSDVKLLSKMPLLGSSVLTQAESWDPEEKIYTVAMAIVWSPKLQDAAMKTVRGDFTPGQKGRFSKMDWINAQDFSSMIGPRRFTDNEGKNLFVGISSIDLAGPVVKQNAKKKLADTMAMKAVAFSIAGDLETYREASQNLKVYADDSKAALSKLSEAVSAKVSLNLNGCLALARKTVKHPITGRKIYVSVYYIDPGLATAAQDFMKKLYADSGLVERITQRKRGVAIGAQRQLDAIKASTEEESKGIAEGAATVRSATLNPKVKTVKAPARVPVMTVPSAKGSDDEVKTPGSSTGGSFSGGTIDMNF